MTPLDDIIASPMNAMEELKYTNNQNINYFIYASIEVITEKTSFF
jgi:hypothetical protein